jgi:uncharacterized metal-binding protein
MSDGQVHATASTALAVAFSSVAFFTKAPQFYECAIGSLIGIFISPDLDLSNGGIVQGKKIEKKIGWIGSKIWRFFWGGYADSCKHGSFVSHFPIFSTFVRMSYIFFWSVFIPVILIKLLVGSNLNLIEELRWWVIMIFRPALFIGLAGSDLIHYAMDILTKESK